MGFWHTGYMEFHESEWLGELPEPAPIVFPCDKCGSLFQTHDDLLRHRFENHPQVRPLLHIQGMQARSGTLKIKSQLSASDILISNASTCLLNGTEVALNELRLMLSEVTNQHVTIELANSDGSITFNLDIRIASESDLVGVEQAFIRMALSLNLSLIGIESFIKDCAAYPSAREYCDGICRYLYGVLAKEQHPDSLLSKEKYVECFNQAENQLKGFNRTIAVTIRSLVTFHFNQFSLSEKLAPSGHIKRAAASFSAAIGGLPWNKSAIIAPRHRNPSADLLTDQDTLAILDWSNFGVNELKTHVDEIEMELGRDIVTYDILKLKLILAEGYYAAGNLNKTRQIARELASNELTKTWAMNFLEKLAC